MFLNILLYILMGIASVTGMTFSIANSIDLYKDWKLYDGFRNKLWGVTLVLFTISTSLYMATLLISSFLLFGLWGK